MNGNTTPLDCGSCGSKHCVPTAVCDDARCRVTSSRRIQGSGPIVAAYTERVAFAQALDAKLRIAYDESGCPGGIQNVQTLRSVKSLSCTSTATRLRTLLLFPSWNVDVST